MSDKTPEKSLRIIAMMQLLKLCVLGAALIAVPATAGQVNEMVMPTEVGEIVLTLEPCPVKNMYGFDYYGYATDPGHPDHFGCWNADNSIVQIWFINENVVGIYKKEMFKPRLSV